MDGLANSVQPLKNRVSGRQQVDTDLAADVAADVAAAGKTVTAERDGWAAKLDLDFYLAGGASQVRYSHRGPLRVQRPFYPELKRKDVCHVYMLHPPGGVVGGDRLCINVAAREGSHSVTTTPGATKFYKSSRQQGQLEQVLTVSAGGVLEWLPQENIFFNQCNASVSTVVRLEQGAGFCGWDIQCLGRPAGGHGFEEGCVSCRMQLLKDGRPLFVDHLQENRALGSSVLGKSTAMRNFTVSGTMLFYSPLVREASQLDELITLISGFKKSVPAKTEAKVRTQPDVNRAAKTPLAAEEFGNAEIAFTRIEGLLVCRYLGHRADDAKRFFAQVRAGSRQTLFGLEAHEPRIWAT